MACGACADLQNPPNAPNVRGSSFQVGIALQSLQEFAFNDTSEGLGLPDDDAMVTTGERKGVDGEGSPQAHHNGDPFQDGGTQPAVAPTRPRAVDLDDFSAPGADALGPLGRAWVAWTKACRRPLRNVRVSPATAVLLNNKDQYGRVIDVVEHLTYTVPSAERKQLGGHGSRAQLVEGQLSKAELAANKAYHAHLVKTWCAMNQWVISPRKALKDLTAVRGGHTVPPMHHRGSHRALRCVSGPRKMSQPRATRSMTSSVSTRRRHRCVHAHVCLRVLASSAFCTLCVVISAGTRSCLYCAQSEWKQWRDIKKRSLIKLPVDLAISKRMNSRWGVPFAYVTRAVHHVPIVATA